MNELNEQLKQFLKELNSWIPPEFIITNWDNPYQNDKNLPYLIGIYHKVAIGTERTEGGGGYGKAYYTIYKRKIDVVYDISLAINSFENGEKLRDLFFRVVRDGAVTIPIYRHIELVEWLMQHPEYRVITDALAYKETEY